MQILVLDGCPRKAARRMRSKKLPGKLLVEAVQLLGKALRQHGRVDDPNLYDAPNASHPCCIWVASGKDAFLWTLKHARECHTIFDRHIRKRCDRCRGFRSKPHASLKALEHLEALVRDGALPASLPEIADPDVFYDAVQAKRAAQPPASQRKSGAVIRPTSGLPAGCASMALAIDGDHQNTCLRYNEDGGVDGVESYLAYHQSKFPDESDATWADPASDERMPTHMCACARRPAKTSSPRTVLLGV
jgi:hypothetical protein